MKIKVLIADDNRYMRESLQALISAIENIEIVGEASNGEEAIEMATKFTPDVILMDINMPRLNGFEATGRIVKNNPGTKIIGLSLHTDMAYCRNMLKNGAHGYIAKTSMLQQVGMAIKEVIAGHIYIDNTMQPCLN